MVEVLNHVCVTSVVVVVVVDDDDDGGGGGGGVVFLVFLGRLYIDFILGVSMCSCLCCQCYEKWACNAKNQELVPVLVQIHWHKIC